MIANKVLRICINVLSYICFPIQLLITWIVYFSSWITQGLLSVVLKFIWTVLFYWSLILLSFVYEKIPYLKLPIAFLGLPIAFIGYQLYTFIPEMNNSDNKISNLLICYCFPFSWHYLQYHSLNRKVSLYAGFQNLKNILEKVQLKDQNTWDYIIRKDFQFYCNTNSISKQTIKILSFLYIYFQYITEFTK